MKCQDIKTFTSCGSYCVNMTMQQLVDSIARDERDMGLILESEFQRGHVWTKAQQIAYIEYFLKGGISGRNLYFNHPDWYHKSEGNYHDYVCVDGLQRITAVRRFMNNEIPAFGVYRKDFEDDFYFTLDIMHHSFNFHVNDLKTKEEVLQWYVEMNEGGTPHTKAEIDKVKSMISGMHYEEAEKVLKNPEMYLHTLDDLIKNNIAEFYVYNGCWYGKIKKEDDIYYLQACNDDSDKTVINEWRISEDTVFDLHIIVRKIDDNLYVKDDIENEEIERE